MDYESIKDDFRSANIVIPTPFTEDGAEVHHDALAEQVEFIREAGTDLYIPCGSLSEYYSLTDEERVETVRTTVEAVDGDGSVIAGVGGSVTEVIDLVDRYEDAGADGLMVIYPLGWGSVDPSGLLEYYRRIVESTDLAVMFYKTNEALSHEVIGPLAEYENVLAVKYTVGGISTFAYEREAVDEDLVWVANAGEDGIIHYAAEGAEGFTTGIGNFVPELSLEIMDAIEQGDVDRVRSLRRLSRPYSELRGQTDHIAAVKYGQELAGLYGGPVRPPRTEIPEDEKERAEELYNRMQEQLQVA